MNFFENEKTLADVKRRYHELVKENHPDVGGDTATMQEINAQYKAAIEWISKHGDQKEAKAASVEVPEEYMAAVSAAVACDGLEVEIVGTWVWVTGNTRKHKETLKAVGYSWAARSTHGSGIRSERRSFPTARCRSTKSA